MSKSKHFFFCPQILGHQTEIIPIFKSVRFILWIASSGVAQCVSGTTVHSSLGNICKLLILTCSIQPICLIISQRVRVNIFQQKGGIHFQHSYSSLKKKRRRVFKSLLGPKYMNMEPAAEKIQRYTLCKERFFLY